MIGNIDVTLSVLSKQLTEGRPFYLEINSDCFASFGQNVLPVLNVLIV